MAQVTKTSFKSTKDTIFADNTTQQISESDHRNTFEDIADSLVFNNGTSSFEILEGSNVAASTTTLIHTKRTGDTNFQLVSATGADLSSLNGGDTFRIGLKYGPTETLWNCGMVYRRGSSTTGGYLTFHTDDFTEKFRIEAGGALRTKEMTAPSTPSSGYGSWYIDSADSKPKVINDAGTVYDLTEGTFTDTLNIAFTHSGQGTEIAALNIVVDSVEDDLSVVLSNTSSSSTSSIFRMTTDNGSEQFIHFEFSADDGSMGMADDGIFYICSDAVLGSSNAKFEVDTSGDCKFEYGAGFNMTSNSTSARSLELYNSGTGDSGINYRVAAQIYSTGIDNSDSDKWNLAVGGTLSSNVVIQIDTSNNFILPSLPTSSAGLPTGAIWSNSGVLTIV